ncbi:Uncharacterised protein [Mycobacteroides abscessus subsp. abscessus]|nr:Uncharacterised protein [Mycobacteroides abscessus subsp. abscessus]SLC94183.1 Uncharacterised protein [Mycobacteroides abscessus subsp. massiliense]
MCASTRYCASLVVTTVRYGAGPWFSEQPARTATAASSTAVHLRNLKRLVALVRDGLHGGGHGRSDARVQRAGHNLVGR